MFTKTRHLAPMLLAVVLSALLPATANAACLSQAEARQAVASGQAKPLGSLARAAGGEIVRADLCEQGGRLVYVLSVLSNGKVVQRVVDARSGRAAN